jgi:hypothetical protein
LHAVTLALLAALPARLPSGPAEVTVAYVTAESLKAAEPDSGDSTGPSDTAVEEETVDERVSQGPGLQVAGLEFDIEKIRRRRHVLFPFATTRLTFLDEINQRFQSAEGRPVNPLGRERRASTSPMLRLTTDAMQQLIDRSWSRRERWRNFSEIAELLEKHDPDAGDAAAVVRTYLDQNLLQPYFDGKTRDPRYWVMLGLAADHAALIDFISDFVREHPSSHVTTELLFMLDEFAQASRDAMLMLLATLPAVDLEATLGADAEAFAFAGSLFEQYRTWARREGVDETNALRARFDDVRIGILQTIIKSTPDGYGAGDARFLLGRILWDRHDAPGALRWWREMAPDARGSYAIASSAIVRLLAAPDSGTSAAISGVLGAEYRRWYTGSAERLATFGYAFDTF